MDRRAFEAEIHANAVGGCWVIVPFDVEEVFGAKRVKVQVTFDGRPHPPYRGSLVRMGEPHHILLMRKEIREQIGKAPGDTVRVVVWKDVEPRTVTVPTDLAEALSADHDARAAFDALSYTHRKEYVQWVEEAKRADTRDRRIVRTVEMVKAGETR